MKTLYVFSYFILTCLLIACEEVGGEKKQIIDTELSNRKISILHSSISVAGSPNIVVDSVGNIFYPDTNQFRVMKIDPTGNQTVFVGGVDGNLDGVGTAAKLSRPYLVARDGNDNIFVADYGNYNIRKITPSGVVTTHVSISSGNLCVGLASDSSGILYCSLSPANWLPANKIVKISPTGVITTLAGSGAQGLDDGNGTAATFRDVRHLATDSFGNVYAVDFGNVRIRKITPTGDTSTLVVGTYFLGVPTYVAVDSSDNIFINDNAFSMAYIRKIVDEKLVTYCGGDIEQTSWEFDNCGNSGIWINTGLAFGPDNSLFFGDGDHILKVSE